MERKWQITIRIVKTNEVTTEIVTMDSAEEAVRFIQQDYAARIDSDLADGIEILNVIEV